MNTPLSLILLHVHFLSGALIAFAVIWALLWLYKYSDKKKSLNLIWTLLVIGVLGILLTALPALSGWNSMSWGHHGGLGSYGMMGGNYSGMADYMEQEFKKNGLPFDKNAMFEEMREHMLGETK